MKITWGELGKQAWPSCSRVVAFASLRMMHGTVRIDEEGNLKGKKQFIDECLRISGELAEGLKEATREGHRNHMSKGAHEQFLWLQNYSDPCGWGLETKLMVM